jgi:hypothetical protein
MTDLYKKIEDFLGALTANVAPSEYAIAEKHKDAGLIVGEVSLADMPKINDHEWIETTPFDFENAIMDAQEFQQNVLVVIGYDPDSDFITQIKEYSSRGLITKKDKNTTIEIGDTIIVCSIQQNILDQISYPYFMSLFGPILRVDNQQ